MNERLECGECEGYASQRSVSRRAFLTGVSAAAAAPSFALSQNTRIAFGAPGDHVLVILSLRGGFDGLGAIAPVHEANYAQSRPHIGLTEAAAVPLDSRFGMHPALGALKPLWDDGDMAVIHAVGQIHPSRSHFAAMAELEKAAPGSNLRTGWLDRVVGEVHTGAPFTGLQIGDTAIRPGFAGNNPEVVTQSLARMYFDFASNPGQTEKWARYLRMMYTDSPDVPDQAQRAVLQTAAVGACSAVKQAEDVRIASPIQGDREYSSGTRTQESLGYTPFTYGEDIATCFQDVARLMRARVGMRVVSVEMEGWDMHAWAGSIEKGTMHDQLKMVGDNIAAFRRDLGPDLWRNVTVVTLSEFGRRLAENGSGGTDHGNGNAVMMFGGSVNGGRVYGDWPGVGAADLVDGDLRATTDYRQIIAEAVAQRVGISNLGSVFPGLTYRPLGLLG